MFVCFRQTNRTQTVAPSLLRFVRASSDLRTQGWEPNDPRITSFSSGQRQVVKGQGCRYFLHGNVCGRIRPILQKCRGRAIKLCFGQESSRYLERLCSPVLHHCGPGDIHVCVALLIPSYVKKARISAMKRPGLQGTCVDLDGLIDRRLLCTGYSC